MSFVRNRERFLGYTGVIMIKCINTKKPYSYFFKIKKRRKRKSNIESKKPKETALTYWIWIPYINPKTSASFIL